MYKTAENELVRHVVPLSTFCGDLLTLKIVFLKVTVLHIFRCNATKIVFLEIGRILQENLKNYYKYRQIFTAFSFHVVTRNTRVIELFYRIH